MRTVSIVVPVYNEELGLEMFHSELAKVIDSLTNYAWRIIYVNDGSRDASEKVIRAICQRDNRTTGVLLSRNFGKEVALSAGVAHVGGDAAIFMDADLQHPPKVIPELLAKWEEGWDVVTTIRNSTAKKSVLKHLGSKAFYAFMSKISDVKIIPNTTDFKLLDARVVKELKRFTERNRMFRGLIDWLGFRTDFVYFDAPERYAGEVSYSFKQLARLAVNSFTSFSLFPLKLAGYLGVAIFFTSFMLLCVMTFTKFVLGSALFSAISFVVVDNTLILGITLMALGLIALYIGRIHEEVINRPLFVARDVVGEQGTNSAPGEIKGN